MFRGWFDIYTIQSQQLYGRNPVLKAPFEHPEYLNDTYDHLFKESIPIGNSVLYDVEKLNSNTYFRTVYVYMIIYGTDFT